MSKTKVNKEPRFSVNKLGEYLTSKSASRRKRIIHEQKYPSAFITSLYKEVREAIIKYIVKDYDEEVILDAIDSISNSVVLKDNEIANSVLVLNEVLSANMPNLDGVSKKRYNGKNPKLNVEGLNISVNPDVILKKGNKIGAIKIHIIKTPQNRLNEESSKLVGTMLSEFADQYVASATEEVDKKLCISIDCFGNSHEIAPQSNVRRWSNIHDACEEIVQRWDSV